MYFFMTRREVPQNPLENVGRESANEERDVGWYEELALKIIQEAFKLGRPLDFFDLRSLTHLIEEFHRNRGKAARHRSKM
jgi:hypothetical protein